MAKLIFGCGYVGLRVAQQWRAAGHRVFAVTRSTDRVAELLASGIEPMVGNLLEAPQITVPQEVRTVLFAVGYDRSTQASIRDVYAIAMTRAIDLLPESIERLIYISSTGVYGNVAGDEVDEQSPCMPTRDGGKASLAAEHVLQSGRFAARSIILRLAGIYGPGRIPRSGDLLAGRPIDAPARGWLNLIHVDDAARIVLLVEERASPPQIYVVSDGHPVQRADYYRELARLVSASEPKFVTPSPDSPAAQRATSDKRVNPRRMFAELQPTLLYPNFRAGLAAIVSSAHLAKS